MTYGEAYVAWSASHCRVVKETTMAAYALSHRTHLLPAFGEADVQRIRRRDVQAWVWDKMDSGLAPKTIRDMLLVLKMVLRWVSEEYDIPVNTYWKMEWPSRNMGGGHKLERYTPEEARRIVEAAQSKPSPYKMGVLLGLTTGMRIGELCGLRFSDIDWEKKTVRVCRTVERIYQVNPGGMPGGATRLVISEPKTKSSRREIPLMREVIPLLKAYSKVSAPDYYVCTLSEHATEPRTYRNAYRNFILKEVGLKHCIKFHGLRHTFATMLIEAKVDVKTVSTILGHRDVSTTLNVYVHPSGDTCRAAINTALRRVVRQTKTSRYDK